MATHEIVLTVPGEEDLPAVEVQSLRDSFVAYFEAADEWRAKAMAVKVTDAKQVTDMKIARSIRLELRGIRTNADKTRKKLKQDILVKGRAIDGMYNMLLAAIKPLEDHLDKQEKFVERMEAEHKEALRAERAAKLAPYIADTTAYPLAEMPDGVFNQLLESSKAAHDARVEAERKAEEERIAREKADAEERERIRQENERLKAEADRIARERAEERRIADEIARAERERREAAERELQRQQREREEAAKAESERIEREKAEKAKAEAAPDKAKIASYIATIESIDVPVMATAAGRDAMQRVVRAVKSVGLIAEAAIRGM